MKRIVLAGVFALSMAGPVEFPLAQTAGSATAAMIQPAAQAEPLVVLVTYDPWAMVIGADTPRFVLYDDGVAIYRTDVDYRVGRLTPEEMATFRASLHPDDLAGLADSYDVSHGTDEPTTEIWLRTGSTHSRVSIYGAMDTPEAQTALPAGIVNAYGRLAAFDRADATPWLPEAIEVVIWPYEYAPDESIVWPKGWPGIHDPTSRQRGENYSLYIPRSEYQALQNFLRTGSEHGAVLIDGQKWAVSLRSPFPKEDRWMGSGDD